MYKKILLIVFCTFMLSSVIYSQDPVCLPDSSYMDSLAGVYPGPFHPVLFPDGGIHDTACINQPFELVLTAVVQDSILFSGLQLKLNHLLIEDNGLLNLPEGLDYACNPPNCRFESNTMGCLIISGTPSNNNEPGVFDLELKSEIVALNGLITITDTLPGFLIPDSHYYLVLDPEDSGHCQELATQDKLLELPEFELLMNPVKDHIMLDIKMRNSQEWKLQLFDFSGHKLVEIEGDGNRERQKIDLQNFALETGNYFIRLISAEGISSKKIVVLSE